MFKTVLALLSGTDSDNSILENSLRLVRPTNGHIECLRTVPDPAALIAQAAQVELGSWMILSDTVAEIEEEGKRRTKTAEANLSRFREKEKLRIATEPDGAGGVSVAWRTEIGDEFDQITKLARYHDAVVLSGGADHPGRLAEEVLGGILIGAGRPVLLVPERTVNHPINNIAIAWKDTAEAARVLTAAMPLLENARQINVLSVNESDRHAGECVNCSDAVIKYLGWHGCDAKGHFLIPEGRPPADVVLETARHQGADLLVMGAYGHSRVREFIFGGFTRRILKGAELPVFLFH
jgi:nucleotide-binding universal stress UspA family protein